MPKTITKKKRGPVVALASNAAAKYVPDPAELATDRANAATGAISDAIEELGAALTEFRALGEEPTDPNWIRLHEAYRAIRDLHLETAD